jgi:heme-degrading monooxygenase HmoA
MFARNLAIHLKPNSLAEFTRIFDAEVLPMLRKQAGFRDEITFSTSPTGTDLIAISLWDTKEHAEAYSATVYAEVLKSLKRVLDGAPKLRVSDVISSTIHSASAVAAAD